MALTIALDAMGGDHAPGIVLGGAEIALQHNPGLYFLLFGDESSLKKEIEKHALLQKRSEIFHAGEAVTNFTKPSQALRQAASSGMGLAIKAVAEKKAAAVVSAGNTGALMALSKMFLKTLPGVDRPAIAKIMPTQKGRSVVLDLGANAECKVEHLVQFALMGEILALYCGIYSSTKKPTIGLLNIGSEASKGLPVLQGAAEKMRDLVNFHGFVEGNDITAGTTDVVVADGFSGNIALKAIEGTAKLIKAFMKEAMESSLRGKVGYLVARSAFKKLSKRMDPRLYNGAILLGLRGIAVKSHGGTDEIGYSEAIKVAVELASQTNEQGEPLFNHDIQQSIARLQTAQHMDVA